MCPSFLSWILAASSLCTARLPDDSAALRLIRERVETRRSVGIVVGIIDSTGHRRVLAYGSATDEHQTPLGPNTVFEIGSVTKTFTAAVLANMVDHGEVSLDDPVTKYLPAEAPLAARGRTIALLDLATQTSGLPPMPNNFHPGNADNPYADYGSAQLYAFLSGYTPPREPGVQYEYSNLGAGLLGHLLSRRAGVSYEQLVRERILVPLGMSDTKCTLPPDMQPRAAIGHNRDGDPVPNWDFDVLAGAGALRSSMHDMLIFLAANLDSAHGPLAGTLHATHHSYRATTLPNTTIGLAWHILHAHGTDIVWHNGETAGYHSFLGFDPFRHVGIVVLSNSATSIDDLGLHLLDERNELHPPPAPPPEMPQDTALLRRYAGTYQLAPGMRLTITKSVGKLYAQVTGQQRFRIFPLSDSTYRWTVVDAQLTFHRDASGAVAGATMRQGGRDMPLARVP
jgi:CubicO group peptidase (beta-lactamase class C family)